jgi:hypothetical protein
VIALTVGLVCVGLAVGVMLILSTARRRPRTSGDELGAAESSFMKGVVKVSLIVMLVAGGMVWLIDRAEDNPPSDSGSETDSPRKSKPNQGGNDRQR